jgi:hypothetical protein
MKTVTLGLAQEINSTYLPKREKYLSLFDWLEQKWIYQ